MTNAVSTASQTATPTPEVTDPSPRDVAHSCPISLSSRPTDTPSMLPPRPSLHSAVQSDDIKAVARAVDANQAAINEVDPVTGKTPMQTALIGNYRKSVSALATLGARFHSIPADCPPEEVSLHAAAELGDPGLLGKVFKAQSNNLGHREMNARDPVSGMSPLSLALRGNHLEAARMLLASGANVDLPNRHGETELCKAVQNGDAAKVKLLLDHGANVWEASKSGQSLVFDAVIGNDPSVITMLLDRGLAVDQPDKHGHTAFCQAAALGSVEAAKILMERGANVSHVTSLSRTAIMLAVEGGHLELFELLLSADKTLLHKTDSRGNTALHLAAEKGHDAILRLVIKSGADLHLKNKGGLTPYDFALGSGNVQAMALLLDAEPDPAKARKIAQQMLSGAVAMGKAPLLEFLLKRGIPVPPDLFGFSDPVIEEMLTHANRLSSMQAESGGDNLSPSLDGRELMDKLLGAAVRNENAEKWPIFFSDQHVSPTLSAALSTAAANTRAVWNSLAGEGQKITPAQQKNWCAGILADPGNAMLPKPAYSASGVTPATRTLLETVSAEQTNALSTAALAAEQPLRDGLNNLLQTCRKAVSGDNFYPMDLYKVLTRDHGVYHHVASLIVSAFADVWPSRSSLGDVTLEQAFAKKLSSLRAERKALQDMNSGTDYAGNPATATMLMFRQLDLLQAWIDKAQD